MRNHRSARLASSVAGLLLFGSTDVFAADAAANCRAVELKQQTRTITPADPKNLAKCISTIPFCTEGTFEGAVEGTVHYDILSLNPLSAAFSDAAYPANVASYAATLTWFLSNGTVEAVETGLFDALPDGSGQFTSILKVTRGTGDFEGATGDLEIAGETDDDDPNAFYTVSFTGTICAPAAAFGP